MSLLYFYAYLRINENYGTYTDELYSDNITSVNKNLPTTIFLEKFSKFIIPLKRKMFLKKSLRIPIIIIYEMMKEHRVTLKTIF